MKALKLFFVLSMFSSVSWAQYSGEPSDPQSEILKQQGKLVTVTLSRGEPLRIFVLGREEAQFDPSDFELTVRRLKPYPAKVMKVDAQGHYYSVQELTQTNEEREVEIKAKFKGKTETLKMKIPAKKP